MGTRNPFPDRCKKCQLRRVLCICEFIPKINLRTKVIILVHEKETRRTSNSGKLAHLVLTNSEMRIRGIKDHPMEQGGLVVPERQSVLLFPSVNAVELTPTALNHFTRPLTLIVPDGNWRQASKVPNREPALFSLPRFKVPLGRPSEYKLRAETRPEGMATFEAIARALGIIEGEEIQNQMEQIFNLKVERMLWSRAKLKLEECLNTIPPEAIC